MKNKSNGFTLIELLAVITIIGVLLFIAIPAISTIIFNARRNTYISTAKALIEDTTRYLKENEGDYYDGEATYYIDTKCLGATNGDKSPFGDFEEAYVVVGYDASEARYNYSWLSYDTAGYGIDLVERDNLTKNDVTDGYEDVSIRQLEGKDGNVYMVNQENNCSQSIIDYSNGLAEEDSPVLAKRSNTAFWSKSSSIFSITFENEINIPEDALYSWDVSSTGNGKVMAYMKKSPINQYYYDVWIQGDGKIFANENSASLFSGMTYLREIINLELLDTSQVTNMSQMFANVATKGNDKFFSLDVSSFDTSKVTNMSGMFYNLASGKSQFTFNLGNEFDTSKVTNMSNMFSYTGRSGTNWSLDLGDKFDTSNVTNMYQMFWLTGYSSRTFTLDLGDKFDTSNVTTMYRLFQQMGYSSNVLTLDLGDKFDTRNVTNMYQMFCSTGFKSTVFSLDLGDKFDTSKVTNMIQMFDSTGAYSTNFVLDLGDKFDTRNVTSMSQMFNRYKGAGKNSASKFTLKLGDKFDTSNVTNMSNMFYYAGAYDSTFTLDLGDKFDTSKVTSMNSMFYKVGSGNPNFVLDLGDKFDISNVTNMKSMFYYTKAKDIRLNVSSFNESVNLSNIFDGVSGNVYVKSQADKDLLEANKGSSSVTVVVG